MARLAEDTLSLQLVICGMHRSGTSLVASALQRAGLDIGRDISGPGPGNPRGHFEDLDFHRLHEDMLAVAGETCFTVSDDFAPPESTDFERRARTLAAKREGLPLWGWKDPRTCLFLEFWDSILPQARYLFLYRHPVDVALSLWRRNNDPELQHDPWLAVSAWEIYNSRLLEFRGRHAERCFLAQVPALTDDLGELVRRLCVKLGLPLHDRGAASVFAPDELTQSTPPNPAWEDLIPGALALYRRLEESADLPARLATAPAARRSAREHELLGASESLLYALLERCGLGGPTPALELRQAYHRVWGGQEEAVVAFDTALAKDGPPIRELEVALSHERLRLTDLAAALTHEQQSRTLLQAELAEERRRAAKLAAALRDEQRRSAMAEARSDAVTQVLAEIEGSRSFSPVRAWWRLRRRLGRQRAT